MIRPKTLVYVSGPYSADTLEKKNDNIGRAEWLAMRIWQIGHDHGVLTPCICPHSNTAHYDKFCTLTHAEWIDGDLVMLKHCDAVMMSYGWADSPGARAEHRYARNNGIPVFYALNAQGGLKEWILTSAPNRQERALVKAAKGLDVEPKNILDEAKEITADEGDRGSSYGPPEEDLVRTAKLWSAVLGGDITPKQVAMCMMQLKISREIHAHKRDNLVDIAGYSYVAQMVEEKVNGVL